MNHEPTLAALARFAGQLATGGIFPFACLSRERGTNEPTL